MQKTLIYIIFAVLLSAWTAESQNAVVVIVGGVRYGETIGAGEKYMPNLWHYLRPQGTLYTNVWSKAVPGAVPGCAAILTGMNQTIAQDGTEYSSVPTLFEYLRKETGAPESTAVLIAGTSLLRGLCTSTDPSHGSRYRGAFLLADSTDDRSVFRKLLAALARSHPRLAVVRFGEADTAAAAGNREGYDDAIRQIDGMISVLWKRLQGDPHYRSTTTLLVTNDYGRNDDNAGGLRLHTAASAETAHIMVAAVGPAVAHGVLDHERRTQTDLAPTIAAALQLPFPRLLGVPLFSAAPVKEKR